MRHLRGGRDGHTDSGRWFYHRSCACLWTLPTVHGGGTERDMLVRSPLLLVIALVVVACSSRTAGAPIQSSASNATATASVGAEATPTLPATPSQLSPKTPSQTSQELVSRCASLRSVVGVPGAGTATVVAAYETTEAGLVQLRKRMEEGTGADSPQATPMSPAFAAQPVLICYFEGTFAPMGSPGVGDSGPTRLVAWFDQDEVVYPFAMGTDATIPIVDPNQLETIAPK